MALRASSKKSGREADIAVITRADASDGVLGHIDRHRFLTPPSEQDCEAAVIAEAV